MILILTFCRTHQRLGKVLCLVLMEHLQLGQHDSPSPRDVLRSDLVGLLEHRCLRRLDPLLKPVERLRVELEAVRGLADVEDLGLGAQVAHLGLVDLDYVAELAAQAPAQLALGRPALLALHGRELLNELLVFAGGSYFYDEKLRGIILLNIDLIGIFIIFWDWI